MSKLKEQDRSPEEIYIYRKKYGITFRNRFSAVGKFVYGHVIQFFQSNEKFLPKQFRLRDDFMFLRKSWVKKYDLALDDIFDKVDQPFTDLTLKTVSFFEALEIDHFTKFKKRIQNSLINSRAFEDAGNGNLGSRASDLKVSLDKIRTQLDSVSWGKLFFLNYRKHRSPDSDLIDFVSVSMVKTRESFFLLRMDVTPSEKFKKEVEKILLEKDTSLTRVHFYSPFTAIRIKRFVSHWSFVNSVKAQNLSDLLSDLNEQVKLTIAGKLGGSFFNHSPLSPLPSIEQYEVGNLEEFLSDKNLQDFFAPQFRGYFESKDKLTTLNIDNRERSNQTVFQIVKKRLRNDEDKTIGNPRVLDDHLLGRSLGFPCAFKRVLENQLNDMRSLRRDVYDFVQDSSKNSVMNWFLLFHYNNRYLKLKGKLTRVLLTTKRFQDEFNERQIKLYTNEYNLTEMQFREDKFHKSGENLFETINKDLRYMLTSLDKKAQNTSSIFKAIEELNSYRTNYLLQIVSVTLAILAFIFAFNKVKSLFQSLLDAL